MSDRPHILVAAPLPPPLAGQSLMTSRTVEVLRETARVTVVNTASRSGRLNEMLPIQRTVDWLRVLRAYRRVLRRDPPGVVYVTPSSSRLGVLRDLALLEATPSTLRVVGHLHVGDYDLLLRDRLFGSLARRVLARLDPLIVPSAYVARGLRGAMPGIPAIVVPNTIAPGHAITDAQRAAKWARAQARGRTILLLANALPGKGHDLLARAAARLGGQAFGRLVIAGAWPSPRAQRAYEAHLSDLGLAEHTEVVGRADARAVRMLLAEADVFAFPSTYRPESFGVALLEAMAAGCAPVAADHAAAADVVEDGVSGRVVAATPEAFASGLADTLRHAERYGRAAAERVRTHFGPERFAEGIRAAVLR